MTCCTHGDATNAHARFEEARTIVHGHYDVYEHFNILFWKGFWFTRMQNEV